MRGLKTLALCVIAAVLFCPAAARAAWTKAETEHFIVYGDIADFLVKDYAVRLSTFDTVLRVFNPPPPRAAPQKVEVYVVRSRKDLKRAWPEVSEDIAGFWLSSADGVFAIAAAEEGPSQNDVLFHEYAHHYMHAYFPAAYPAWFVEGWAEYFMTTRIEPRSVIVGDYSRNRADWLFATAWLPMDQVLSKTTDQAGDVVDRQLFYAQSWLLTHYMRSTRERAAQMDKITAAIAGGMDSVTAFKEVTAMTPQQLTQQLRRYQALPMTQIKDLVKTPPAVTLSKLPPSAEDLLLDRLRLVRATPSKPDPAFLGSVRSKAAKYPGDKLADLTLARAEFIYGDVSAGEAILNRRLQANPDEVDALAEAGLGQVMAARREPANREARLRAARPFFAKAYQLNPEDFRTLYGYAYSRTIEPGFPSDNDVKALLEARLLAPSVDEIALLAGTALLMRNDPADARRVLEPVANNPHGGGAARRAKALLNVQSAREAAAIANSDDDDE